MYLEPRECPSCRFVRIPDTKIVIQKGKYYKIFTCTLCKMRDIENHKPAKLWDGKFFVDEVPDHDADADETN